MSKPIALVTGASRGLGLEIARKLAKEGYDVYGTSRNPSKISIEEPIAFLKLELRDKASIDALVQQLPEVDLLVNNAGNGQIGSVEEITRESIEELFEINLVNQIMLTKKYIPQMRERKSGTIVTVTSMAGTIPVPFSTLYATVKAGLDAFTKGLRNELINYNVKVFAAAPFQMDTSIPQTIDFKEDSPYLNEIIVAKDARDRALKNSEDPVHIAQKIIELIRMKNPPAHNALGHGSWRKEWIIKHMPKKMVERMVRKRFDLDY